MSLGILRRRNINYYVNVKFTINAHSSRFLRTQTRSKLADKLQFSSRT